MTNENNIENKNETQIHERKTKILIPIILSISIVILLTFGFTFLFISNRTDKIISNIINSIYDDYKTTINNRNTINLKEQSFIINGKLNIQTNIPGLEELTKEQLNYKIGIDSQNEKALVDFSLLEDNNKLINFIYYFINNETYMKLDDYNKLIKTDTNNSINFNKNETNNKMENINYILEEFKNILIKSLDMKAFKKDSTTLENTKVNKITLNLTKENIKKLNDNLSKNILKNKELLTKISETFNIEIDELKNNLNNKNNYYEDCGEISFYTNKRTNKLKMIEYSNNETKIQITYDDKINKITIDNKIYNIILNIKENNENILNIDYQINYGIALKGNLTIENKKTNNKYEANTNFTIQYLEYDFNIKGNNVIELTEDLFEIDYNNTINQNEVTPDEYNKIIENIMYKLENSNISKLIKGFSNITY